jgi:hypothetical protein
MAIVIAQREVSYALPCLVDFLVFLPFTVLLHFSIHTFGWTICFLLAFISSKVVSCPCISHASRLPFIHPPINSSYLEPYEFGTAKSIRRHHERPQTPHFFDLHPQLFSILLPSQLRRVEHFHPDFKHTTAAAAAGSNPHADCRTRTTRTVCGHKERRSVCHH